MRLAATTLAIVGSAAGATSAMAASAEESKEPSDVRRSITRFLDDVWPHGASGTLIAARRGGRPICKSFGLADRARQIRARCNTVYDTGSITKQFTAAAILKLEMMGKLEVSDPISKFVGPVPDDKRAITVHHLLTHTAGLLDALGHDYAALSRQDMLRRALESRLQSSPGTTYAYSNVGYSILAAIVEREAGMGYERFLEKYLWGPAGMRQTGYVLPKWERALVAVDYDATGRSHGRPFDRRWAHDGPYWNLRGNGGVLSTALDMLRWHRALTHDSILSDTAKRKLFTPFTGEGGGSFYGYGWSILPTAYGRVVTHNGGNGLAYARIMRILRPGAFVFFATNRARSERNWNLEQLDERLTTGVARRLLRAR